MSASTGPPEEPAPTRLPPRWGTDTPSLSPAPETTGVNTTGGERNPFVSRDRPPPLVQAAQGAGVSGGRAIALGFATGERARCLLPVMPALHSIGDSATL